MESWGYQAFPVSAATGAGLSAMHGLLAGNISVVAGPSGAGKSSIINAIWSQQEAANPGSNNKRSSRNRLAEAVRNNGLMQPDSAADSSACAADTEAVQAAGAQPSHSDDAMPSPSQSQSQGPAISTAQWLAELAEAEAAQARLIVGNVSALCCDARVCLLAPDAAVARQVSAIGRGRHTTRNVTLLEVAGGLLADTPGFNQPSLEGMPAAELPELFPEIQDRLGRYALASTCSCSQMGMQQHT